MKFVLKVLVLAFLIVVSKFVQEEDTKIASNQKVTPANTVYPEVSGQLAPKKVYPATAETPVEKASLQFN